MEICYFIDEDVLFCVERWLHTLSLDLEVLHNTTYDQEDQQHKDSRL